jgi:hypothetical protein
MCTWALFETLHKRSRLGSENEPLASGCKWMGILFGRLPCSVSWFLTSFLRASAKLTGDDWFHFLSICICFSDSDSVPWPRSVQDLCIRPRRNQPRTNIAMATPAPLDLSLLVLSSDEEDFLKAITKIDDAQELRDHIQMVAKEAYEVSR